MSIAIRVENLSKLYKIGKKEPYMALRDALSESIKKLFRKNEKDKENESYIWALKNVSFEVKEGEIVGIIGRNGAGKTTLLKILSRITYPTEGKAVVKGKVGSLLEVGIGFHPELTGRENIYLYGTILGMKKKEIDEKFDEIVEFSELSQFIDTPVKYYSSGMYVRLAFSVASYLDTDILLVDEVLAVGDIGFQKKCFKKMEDIREKEKEARTILVVSHNMDAIMRLCRRAILLDKGKVIADGDAKHVVELYLKSFGEIPAQREWEFEEAPGDEFVKIKAIRLKDKNGNIKNAFDVREPIFVEIDYWVLKETNACASIHVFNQMGVFVIATGENSDLNKAYKIKQKGLWRATCEIPANLLADTRYILRVVVLSPKKNAKEKWHIDLREIISFYAYDPLEGDSARGDWGGNFPAVIMPKLKWETNLISEN